MSNDGKPIILDLCAGTGSWSKPYQESGRYDVRLIDPYANGLFDTRPADSGDVRLFRFPDYPVHGILAAPPCTYFSLARTRPVPGDPEFVKGLSIVDACLRVIMISKPKWWAMENPKGRLHWWIGPAQLKFDPCDYGDPYTKATMIWGNFAVPGKGPVEPIGKFMDIDKPGRANKENNRSRRRSITPPGFAAAFFEANQ